MSELKEESDAKKMKLSEELPAIEPKHCQHWVVRKKRFCKMTIGEKSWNFSWFLNFNKLNLIQEKESNIVVSTPLKTLLKQAMTAV